MSNFKDMDTMDTRLSMLLEANRLETFRNWPFTNVRCNAAKMAEAGFFWTGTAEEPDAAQCFVCCKQLEGWEPTDDPWEEHKSHSSSCPFVKWGKSEEQLTVIQIVELWKKMTINILTTFYERWEKEYLQQVEETKNRLLIFQENLC